MKKEQPAIRWGAEIEYPADQQRALQKAKRLQWWTIAFLVTTGIALYLTMGQSQAMKTAWAEDMLGLIPPIVFLITMPLVSREPNQRFPFGYHRTVMIGHLIAALALVVVGALLLYDASVGLVTADHPSIGTVELFGQHVWLGWLMFPVLVWGTIPPIFLGRAKMPLACMLQDKLLYASAKMNKADWMTSAGPMVGVAGIAMGIWWLDYVVAALISADILKDGITNLRDAVLGLMDQSPRPVGEKKLDPLIDKLAAELEAMPGVRDARVRLREEGHVYFGDISVVLASEKDTVGQLERIAQRARSLDWRLHDIAVVPVKSLN